MKVTITDDQGEVYDVFLAERGNAIWFLTDSEGVVMLPAEALDAAEKWEKE